MAPNLISQWMLSSLLCLNPYKQNSSSFALLTKCTFINFHSPSLSIIHHHLLHLHPSSGEGVSPVQGQAIRRRHIKPEYLSYPVAYSSDFPLEGVRLSSSRTDHPPFNFRPKQHQS